MQLFLPPPNGIINAMIPIRSTTTTATTTPTTTTINTTIPFPQLSPSAVSPAAFLPLPLITFPAQDREPSLFATRLDKFNALSTFNFLSGS